MHHKLVENASFCQRCAKKQHKIKDTKRNRLLMGAGFKYHERYEPSVKHKRLEDPLRSEARTGVEAMVSCEVD